jgi:hypothetical protein
MTTCESEQINIEAAYFALHTLGRFVIVAAMAWCITIRKLMMIGKASATKPT